MPHLYNAMRPFESREPGVVGAIWDSPTAYASIIADGYHCDLPPSASPKNSWGSDYF
ncbi:MAG: hypothetical protein R2822_24480 [Spirosomataceae bacterium]